MSRRKRGRPPKQKSNPPVSQSTDTPYQGMELKPLPPEDIPIEEDEAYQAREKLAKDLAEREKDEWEPIGEESDEDVEEQATEPEPEDEETTESAEEEGEPEEGLEQEAAEAEEDTRAEEVEPKPPAPLIIDDNATYTIKVDGKEETITGRDLKARSQKDRAADKRLEEATRLLTEARDRDKARLSEQKDAGRTLQPVPAIDTKRVAALYESIRYGEEEEGTKALQEIIDMGRAATPEKDQILAQVEYMLERDKLFTVFRTSPEKGGYADLLPVEQGGMCEDPDVFGYLNYKVNQAIASGKPDAVPTYTEAAEEVRARFRPKEEAPKPADTFAEKRERKRTIDVVKGVKAKTQAKPPENKEPTQEDILNEHRKHRGLL